MAVESLQSKSFTLKSDVWAFAVTAWEIFSFAKVLPVPLTVPSHVALAVLPLPPLHCYLYLSHPAAGS